jgi:hypothetical protein
MLAAAIAAPKISFDTFAMTFFSAFNARRIGLHPHKFHHTLLSMMQSRVADGRRIAANTAKLPELLRTKTLPHACTDRGGRRDCIPRSLQTRLLKVRVEAARLNVSIWPFARLGEGQKSRSAGCKARGAIG